MSNIVPIQVSIKKNVSNSWLFRFMSLAFIYYYTPVLAVTGRGLIGFFIIIIFAVFLGILEKSFRIWVKNLQKGIIKNKLIFFLTVFYSLFFIVNSLLRGRGFSDWRLMISPIIIILSLIFSFGFLIDNGGYRKFIISFILFQGFQAILSIYQLSQSVDIARVAWVETHGAWIYGNQLFYAIIAIILPVILFTSLNNGGYIKYVLFLSCLAMLVEISLSSFATPLALIFIGVILIFLLTLPLILTNRKRLKIILIIGIIIFSVVIGVKNTVNNPFFSSIYTRIINVLEDPTSGGYRVSGGVSRWYLAEKSLNSFRNSPIIGVGGPPNDNPFVGGHSSLFDNLAIYGLIGGGSLVSLIFLYISRIFTIYIIKPNWESILHLTTILLFLIAGIVNPYWEGSIPIVFIIIFPLIFKNRIIKPNTAFSN